MVIGLLTLERAEGEGVWSDPEQLAGLGRAVALAGVQVTVPAGEVVADEFGLSIDRIRSNAADTSKVPNASATAASSDRFSKTGTAIVLMCPGRELPEKE